MTDDDVVEAVKVAVKKADEEITKPTLVATAAILAYRAAMREQWEKQERFNPSELLVKHDRGGGAYIFAGILLAAYDEIEELRAMLSAIPK